MDSESIFVSSAKQSSSKVAGTQKSSTQRPKGTLLKRQKSQSPTKTVCKKKGRRDLEDSDDDDDSSFKEILKNAGLRLRSKSNTNELLVDQAIFQRNLSNAIKKSINTGVIEDFVNNFEKLISEKNRLLICLKGTVTSEQCESARGQTQDCLIRLVLGVDSLQTRVAKVLLEKATELAYEESVDQSGSLSSAIFSQLRFCKIIDESVSDKILEILGVLPLNLQKDLIHQLPEIFDSSHHSALAKKLCDLLMEKQELSVVIVDALSNMDIKGDTFEEVKHTVLKSVQSASIEDLPVLIHFLLQDLDGIEAFLTISDLRCNIDLTPVVPVVSTQGQNNGLSQSYITTADKGIDILVLEVILQQCTIQKSVWEAWIKAIEKVNRSSEHKPLDILVLVGLFPSEKCKKLVESIFRMKVKSGYFSSSLIEKTFKEHPNVLKQHFEEVLSLGSFFLRSSETVLIGFGSCIYMNAFKALEKYCKREVVSSLISLVSYGNIAIQTAALDTISNLAQKATNVLAEYCNFLKFLLDRLEIFSLFQIRKVYFILNRLAYQGGNEGELIQDELHIIITKQLLNTEMRYQKMGIIGALMAAKEMSGTREEDRSSINASAIMSLSRLSSRRSSKVTPSSGNLSKKAISLLKVINDRSDLTSEVLGLFWDELSRAFLSGELNDKLEDWVDSSIASRFEDEYVAEYSSDFRVCNGIKLEPVFNLEPFTDESIILNLGALVIKDELITKGTGDSLSEVKASAKNLCSHFRLLRMCIHSREGDSLEDIDALLVCAITMPASYSLDEAEYKVLSSDKKNLLCVTVFHCLNWFREVVNAFAQSPNADDKAKVLQRIDNIVKLQKKLEILLKYNCDFRPPKTNFDLSDVSPSVTIPIATKPKSAPKSKGSGRGRKRALGGADKENLTQRKTQAETEDVSPSAIQTPAPTNIDKPLLKNGVFEISLFRPYFRELDLTTFVLLECGMKIPDSEIEDANKCTEAKLEPSHLEFLLDDLLIKLRYILPTTVSKRVSALKVANVNRDVGLSNLQLYTAHEVASCMVNMLPSFCTLLEDCNSYFELLSEKNDASADDDAGLESDTTLIVSNCVLNIIQILNVILSWNGLNDPETIDLLEQAMFKLGSRLDVNSNARSSFVEKSRLCFRYLTKFETFLPTLDCALALINLLETVAKHSLENTLSVQVSEMAEMFLQRSWTSAIDIKDTGVKNNNKIRKILEAYLSHTPDVLKCLELLLNTPIEQLKESDNRNPKSADFPTLTKQTFSIYYASMTKYLVEYVRSIEVYKKNATSDGREILKKWNSTSVILKELVTLVKKFDARANLKMCLVHSNKYLELFIRNCMPLLEATFKEMRDEVVTFLKNIQQTTRFLQSCCHHTKKNLLDPTLTWYVPAVKKNCEILLCDVKAMLAANKCQNAFWIGTLKTRDLTGKEVEDSESGSDDNEDERSDEEEDKLDSGAETEKYSSEGY